uniref:Uncharacterized protein n=1 Tax=Anguilla anguilla TaxID=7936 RepID=A0A0E9Q2C2_ANGAN
MYHRDLRDVVLLTRATQRRLSCFVSR